MDPATLTEFMHCDGHLFQTEAVVEAGGMAGRTATARDGQYMTAAPVNSLCDTAETFGPLYEADIETFRPDCSACFDASPIDLKPDADDPSVLQVYVSQDTHEVIAVSPPDVDPFED